MTNRELIQALVPQPDNLVGWVAIYLALFIAIMYIVVRVSVWFEGKRLRASIKHNPTLERQ